MRVQFTLNRMALAESLRASVEALPEYKVKTPLQRAIQILKRHRDIMFANDQHDRPISIIISTLAARAYENEADLLDALQTIVSKMPNLIERDAQGNAIVRNPVNPLENFADKWRKHPQRETKFLRWLQQVQVDLDAALRTGDVRDMTEVLKPRFGDRAVNEASKEAFPTRFSAGSTAAAAAPTITISNPSKPWRP